MKTMKNFLISSNILFTLIFIISCNNTNITGSEDVLGNPTKNSQESKDWLNLVGGEENNSDRLG